MDLKALRVEREKWMTWKNIKPLREAIASLPQLDASLLLGDTVSLKTEETVDHEQIESVARMMMPWRKGPFDLFGLKYFLRSLGIDASGISITAILSRPVHGRRTVFLPESNPI